MSGSFVIRPAEQSDLSSIVLLDMASNPHPWGESLIKEALNTRTNWVVEHTEEASISLFGWLTASFVFDQSELELIVVSSAVRRQGLAKKLMKAWLAQTKNEAVCEDLLEVREDLLEVREYLLEVRESNLGAIGLYQSFGFELVGRRKNYYQTEIGHEAACLYTLKR